MKSNLCILLFLLSCTKLFAQTESEFFSMGLVYGGAKYGGFETAENESTNQLNLRPQWRPNYDNEAIFIDFSYQIPNQFGFNTTAYAKDINNPIKTIEVSYQIEHTGYNATLNTLHSFNNGSVEPHLYLFGGLGAGWLKKTFTFKSYDNSNYRIAHEDQNKDQEKMRLNLDLGIGLNYTLNRFKIFAEAKGSLLLIVYQEISIPGDAPIFATTLNIGVGYIIIE